MNFFDLPKKLPEEELFETIIPDNGVLIERIISSGQTSPPGFWFDQERDEWVLLLQGEAILQWEDSQEIKLFAGDWAFIPAHKRHRVEYTSIQPPCIWLAVHGQLSAKV